MLPMSFNPLLLKSDQQLTSPNNTNIEVMRIKKMITKGELRPVGQIRRICMLILGNKGLRETYHQI